MSPRAIASLALGLAVGCGGGGGDALIDVGGNVAYRGEAVPGGTILLQPVSGKSVIVPIDEQGRYRASLAAGTYRVAVVSSRGIPEDVDPWQSGVKLPPPLVPDKYGRPETSGMSLTASPGDATIDISLE